MCKRRMTAAIQPDKLLSHDGRARRSPCAVVTTTRYQSSSRGTRRSYICFTERRSCSAVLPGAWCLVPRPHRRPSGPLVARGCVCPSSRSSAPSFAISVDAHAVPRPWWEFGGALIRRVVVVHIDHADEALRVTPRAAATAAAVSNGGLLLLLVFVFDFNLGLLVFLAGGWLTTTRRKRGRLLSVMMTPLLLRRPWLLRNCMGCRKQVRRGRRRRECTRGGGGQKKSTKGVSAGQTTTRHARSWLILIGSSGKEVEMNQSPQRQTAENTALRTSQKATTSDDDDACAR